jgi:hypothetical protein
VHGGSHRGSEIHIWLGTCAGAYSCIRDYDDAVARLGALYICASWAIWQSEGAACIYAP